MMISLTISDEDKTQAQG